MMNIFDRPYLYFYVFIMGFIKMTDTIDHDIQRPFCVTDVSSSKITCSFLGSFSELPVGMNKSFKLVIMDSNFTDFLESDRKHDQEFEKLREVHLLNSYLGHSAIVWLQELRNVEAIMIKNCSNGKVTLDGRRGDGINMTVLNLDLSPLSSLQSLEISMCNLLNLKLNQSEPMPKLWLSDNLFECLNDFTWLLTILDKPESKNSLSLKNTSCFIEKFVNATESYPMEYSLAEQPFVLVMRYRKEAETNCPPKCSCKLMGMHLMIPQLYVNCISVNMTEMPQIIPKGSNRLDLSHNCIEDISPLYHSSIYKDVKMFTLSYNEIKYLDPVMFPQWMREKKEFGINLDHNMLEKIPAKEIEQVLYDLSNQQRYVPRFILDHNPYLCTCDYIIDFRNLVYGYLIKDGGLDIRCSEKDLYNPKVKVLNIDIDELCPQQAKLHTIDLLNISLTVILFMLILNFAFNYYMYKKYQKLPWIITKIKW